MLSVLSERSTEKQPRNEVELQPPSVTSFCSGVVNRNSHWVFSAFVASRSVRWHRYQVLDEGIGRGSQRKEIRSQHISSTAPRHHRQQNVSDTNYYCYYYYHYLLLPVISSSSNYYHYYYYNDFLEIKWIGPRIPRTSALFKVLNAQWTQWLLLLLCPYRFYYYHWNVA